MHACIHTNHHTNHTTLMHVLQLKTDFPDIMLREKGFTPPPKHALNLKGVQVGAAACASFFALMLLCTLFHFHALSKQQTPSFVWMCHHLCAAMHTYLISCVCVTVPITLCATDMRTSDENFDCVYDRRCWSVDAVTWKSGCGSCSPNQP